MTIFVIVVGLLMAWRATTWVHRWRRYPSWGTLSSGGSAADPAEAVGSVLADVADRPLR